MAVQAPDIIRQGPVQSIFIECFVNHVFVTLPAQHRALFLDLEGIGRGGFKVAFRTFILGHRRMHFIVYDSPFVGTVRAVAGVAGSIGHGVIRMPL